MLPEKNLSFLQVALTFAPQCEFLSQEHKQNFAIIDFIVVKGCNFFVHANLKMIGIFEGTLTETSFFSEF